jgi:ribose-phosphate pyrophosphokinase
MLKVSTPDIKLFSGNANPKLAASIAHHLKLSLGQATVGHFSDHEIMVEILENVRGCESFLIQSTCHPVNDNIMELVIMADALKRASSIKVTAVIPYFGYARQDRRVRSARVPISARVVADMLKIVNIDRVMTVDLHADQIQGFFNIPVDNIYPTSVIIEDIEKKSLTDITVISPDIGGVVRARAFAKRIKGSDLAIIDKRRSTMNHSKVMNVIGDIKDRNCIIVDDILDTAGTLCNAAAALKEHGAKSVMAYCTHPVLSGQAIDNIQKSYVDEVVVTDTVPLHPAAEQSTKLRQLSLAPLIAEAIRRVYSRQSVSLMFL